MEHINRQRALGQPIAMEFMTECEWEGVYPAKLLCQNGAVVEYSPPVEFGGMKGPVSPEDAFVGAANMCFQIVFAGIAKSLGVDIVRYSSKATGQLETVDGVRRFTSITLTPEIVVAEGSDVSKVEKALEATKARCLVTNSMNTRIVVSARISS
jgi:organic hydroperoxide reductase OsmC/OhrA